jgi:IclR family acetate operon transcriptional repressor
MSREELSRATVPSSRTTPSEAGGEARLEEARAGDLTQLGAMGKAFSILEIIVAAGRPLTMAEIVRASGLTKPTAHRITSALAEMGFIERDLLRRGYVEGPRAIRLALATLEAAAPRSLRHAILRSVSEAVGETANLGVLIGAEVQYLDRVEAKWPLGLRFDAGSRVPAHCTAIGKLLLSQLPARERAHMLIAMPLRRHTPRTIADARELADALETIAHTEIGTDDEEFLEGVVCVAVPVLSGDGDAIAAIAVSAPRARVDIARAMSFVPVMREAARRMAATFRLPDDEVASGEGEET